MSRLWSSVTFGLVLSACSSTDVGPNAPTAQDKANEQLAVQNVMCAFEPHPEGKQSSCDHLIENRLLLGRMFLPATLGGIDEAEKIRGRRVTTKFIVKAAASIKQCQKVSLENTITIIRDVKIAGGTYLLKGTAPLEEGVASCFITPVVEGS